MTFQIYGKIKVMFQSPPTSNLWHPAMSWVDVIELPSQLVAGCHPMVSVAFSCISQRWPFTSTSPFTRPWGTWRAVHGRSDLDPMDGLVHSNHMFCHILWGSSLKFRPEQVGLIIMVGTSNLHRFLSHGHWVHWVIGDLSKNTCWCKLPDQRWAWWVPLLWSRGGNSGYNVIADFGHEMTSANDDDVVVQSPMQCSYRSWILSIQRTQTSCLVSKVYYPLFSGIPWH